MASSKRDVNVVFLGPTGSGKSRLCNVLLKDDTAFPVNISFQSVTKGIASKWISVPHNDQLTLFKFIDTQGLADTNMSDKDVIKIVKDALKKDITYVNYFVIVFNPGRLTNEIRKALECIVDAFSLDNKNRKQHVLFALTHCECASEHRIATYKNELLADRTTKRLLVIEEGEIKNLFFTGLPQLTEVVGSMQETIPERIDSQRRDFISYFLKPIEKIKPVHGVFANLCTIL